MSKYKVLIEVNEKKLRRIGNKEEENKNDSLEWLIENEFGWLKSSGITLIRVGRNNL